MEKLAFTTPSLPIGLDVIRFSETESGSIELSEYSDMKEFPEIEFGFYDNPFSKIFTAGGKNRLSESFQAIPWNATGLGLSTTIPQRILSLLSTFYYMLISPLACISSMIISGVSLFKIQSCSYSDSCLPCTFRNDKYLFYLLKSRYGSV